MNFWRMQLHPSDSDHAVSHTVRSLGLGYIGLDFANPPGDLTDIQRDTLDVAQRDYWEFAHTMKVGDKVLCVPTAQNGLWERYVVTEEQCVAIDPRCTDEEAVLAQPLGTAIFALKKLPTLLDLDVVIVGQGPMGQLFNSCCKMMGARQVIGIDKLESRLKTSWKTGVTSTICNATESPLAKVKELTDGKGADLVIEAVGHSEQQFNLCIELLGYGGRILYFGVAPEIINGLRWRDLIFKNGSVYTSIGPSFRRDFPLAMQWIAEKRIDVKPLVTHTYKLADIQTAFETFRDRRDGAIKVFVEFPAYRRKQ